MEPVHASPAPVNPYFSGAAGTRCILQESTMDMQYKYETNTFLVTFRLHVCLAIPSIWQACHSWKYCYDFSVSTSGDVHGDCVPPPSAQHGWGCTEGSLPAYSSPDGKPPLSFGCRVVRLFVTPAAPTCSSRSVTLLPIALPLLTLWSSWAILSEDSSRYERCLLSYKDVLSRLRIAFIHTDAGMYSPVLPIIHHPSGPRAHRGGQKKWWRSQPRAVRLPAARGSALGAALRGRKMRTLKACMYIANFQTYMHQLPCICKYRVPSNPACAALGCRHRLAGAGSFAPLKAHRDALRCKPCTGNIPAETRWTVHKIRTIFSVLQRQSFSLVFSPLISV